MPSLGRVSLIRRDLDDAYKRMIRNRALTISKYIIDKESFYVLCQFLLKYRDLKYFNDNFNEWVKEIKSYNKTLKLKDIDLFIQSLRKAYKNSKDDNEVSDLRGVLFEVILEGVYKHLYQETREKNNIFEHGCEVAVDSKPIYYENMELDEKKKTVDIAGYNLLNSEFYEIKVGPKYFTRKVINYLNHLNSTLHKENISQNITVGCMTMDTKDSLKQNLMKIEILDKVKPKDLV